MSAKIEKISKKEKSALKALRFLKMIIFAANIQAMKKRTYKTKATHTAEAHEPFVSYGVSRKNKVAHDGAIPDGYMPLDQFGEIFHQKLDANYENIHRNSQQESCV
ncbi:MAG: hypothetical protein IKZ52_08175 [Bacteroidales bacterium]|nr:hypothetical protein [Bacteroidales bacterium]